VPVLNGSRLIMDINLRLWNILDQVCAIANCTVCFSEQ